MRAHPVHVAMVAGFAVCCASAVAQPAGEPRGEGGPVIVGENAGKWKRFDLQRLRAALEFMVRRRSDKREQTGQPTTKDTELLLRETAEVSGEAYIGHKNFMDLTGRVRIGLEDRDLDNETFGAKDHSQDFIDLFDVNAHMLGASRVPFDLYARRDELLLDRDFSSSLTSRTFEVGAVANIQSDRAPTTLRVFRLESTQSDPLGLSDYEIDQNSFALRSNVRVAERNSLEVDYALDDVTERDHGLDAINYLRHNLQLTDVQNFGDQRPHELRSYLRYFDQDGRSAQRILRWDEQLLLSHSDRLETRYSTTLERQTRGGADVDLAQASASITHHLFESLTSYASVGARRISDSDEFRSNEWFADGRLEYTKMVPKGRLDASLGASMNLLNTSERGSTLGVLDERATVGDLTPITLRRRHIVGGSVVVTAAGGFPTYQEGIDYTVEYFPDRVEIRRIVGGGMAPGATVLVDYDLGPEPERTIDTYGASGALRYTFTEGRLRGLSPYVRYRLQQQSSDLDDPTLILDDTSTLTYGAEFRRGGFYAKAERENHTSDVSPFDATRFVASQDWFLGPGSNVGLSATHEILDHSSQDNHIEFTRLSARWNQRLSASTDMLLRVDYRDEHDDRRGDTQGLEQYLTLHWRKRQTSAYITLRNTLLDSTNAERTSQMIEFGLRREF